MKDSETNKGTDTPCENCGNLFYTMGDYTTRCDDCGASIADNENGKVFRSDGKIVYSTPGGTLYEQA